MNAPSVTAIVATKDRPQLLRRCVEAVLSQRYAGPLDLIVVYDGQAPDRAVCETDPGRIQVLTNHRTPGLAGARNTGMLAASGEYLAFCDDDDCWLPEKLATQIRRLQHSPRGSVAVSGIRIVSGQHRVERRAPEGTVERGALLRHRTAALHPSTIVANRAIALSEIGLVNETIPGGYGEDYDWLLRAAGTGGLVAVPDVLTEVHWHESSYFDSQWTTMAAGLEWILRAHPDFARCRRGNGRVKGQIAFAYAAAGRRGLACRWAWSSLRASPLEPRPYLSLAVAGGMLRPAWLVRQLHARGRGI